MDGCLKCFIPLKFPMDTNRIELTMVEMSMEEKPCLLQILTFSPINKLHI